MTIALAFLPLLLGAFYAWRYASRDIDPDWAMFNLWRFTGSVYGKDFADCKTPGVHLWYAALGRVFGPSIERVRFANHLLVSLAGSAYFLMTGDLAGALAFVIVVNSGWLLAFHGNVGQVSGALVLLSLGAADPWLSAALMVAAVAFEPKLLVALVLMYWRWPWEAGALMTASGLLAVVFFLFSRDWWARVWESSVTIPRRMLQARGKSRGYGWVPWFTAQGFAYLMPWLVFAVWHKPDAVYWLPAAGYLVLIGTGAVIRENHLLPLAAWIGGAGVAPEILLALAATDWVSAGFYFGDIWGRFYLGLRDRVKCARAAGEWLRDKPGSVWVNGIHTEVYIHARRPILYGLAEQIEIREVAEERRLAMRTALLADPPDWIVQTPDPALQLRIGGYRLLWRNDLVNIYKREGLRYDDYSEDAGEYRAPAG